MEGLALLILESWWRAVLATTFFGLLGLYVLPFTIASAAAAALYTLRYGIRSGLVVTLLSIGLMAALNGVLPERPGFPFPPVFALFPPLLLSAELLRRTASLGAALSALALYMALYLLWTHWSLGDVVQFWDRWLREAVKNVPGATVRGFYQEGTVRLFNGLVAVLYEVTTFVALLLARWWWSLVIEPGGFKREFLQLRTPPVLLALFVGLMWFVGSALEDRLLMSELFIVAMGTYMFQGLAALHGLKEIYGWRWYFLLPVYAAFWVMPSQIIPALALFGTADLFVDFRRRLGKREEG